MSNKYDFIARVISKIDDEVIDKNTEKRAHLMDRTSRAPSKRKKWIPIAAAAACILIMFGSVFGWMISGGGKQVPIYQGMTVSYDAPVVDSGLDYGNVNLSAMPLSATYSTGGSAKASLLGNTESINIGAESDVSADGRYYAMKNEDIYIYVHISNPDGFEILSFTINGVKYSSYMFEDGSDLETLILKYNVGDVNGLQEYTIDAIKYVDGEKIKDVKMEGDRTVEVYVNPDASQEACLNAEISAWDLTIDPVLPAGVSGFVSLELYDGSQRIAEYSPADTVFRNLPSGKKLVLIGKYLFEGEERFVAHTFETPKESEGLLVVNGVVVGIGSCTDSVLYLNMPIDDRVFADQKGVLEVFLGSGVTAIGEGAFANCTHLNKVTFAEGVETIGADAFAECTALESIELPKSVATIGSGAFARCSALESIEIPDSVTTLGAYTFNYCTKLSSVTIGSGVTDMDVSGCGLQVWNPETGEYVPIQLVVTFENCPALSSVTFGGTKDQWRAATNGVKGGSEQIDTITVHCADGDLLLVPYGK